MIPLSTVAIIVLVALAIGFALGFLHAKLWGRKPEEPSGLDTRSNRA